MHRPHRFHARRLWVPLFSFGAHCTTCKCVCQCPAGCLDHCRALAHNPAACGSGDCPTAGLFRFDCNRCDLQEDTVEDLKLISSHFQITSQYDVQNRPTHGSLRYLQPVLLLHSRAVEFERCGGCSSRTWLLPVAVI